MRAKVVRVEFLDDPILWRPGNRGLSGQNGKLSVGRSVGLNDGQRLGKRVGQGLKIRSLDSDFPLSRFSTTKALSRTSTPGLDTPTSTATPTCSRLCRVLLTPPCFVRLTRINKSLLPLPPRPLPHPRHRPSLPPCVVRLKRLARLPLRLHHRRPFHRPLSRRSLFPVWQTRTFLPPPQPFPSNAATPTSGHASFCRRRRLRVLSLFDGVSAAMEALVGAGLEPEVYAASEIDEKALRVSQRRHPSTIRLGDVRFLDAATLARHGPFDLLLGGSPCADFSRVNPRRRGLDGDAGRLFRHFPRVLRILRRLKRREDEEKDAANGANNGANNGGVFYLFENVVMDWINADGISTSLGQRPVILDAVHFAPMRRRRMFWTNIPLKPVEESTKGLPATLQSILEPDRFARVARVRCVTTKRTSLKQGADHRLDPVLLTDGSTDVLTILEIERLFGLPDGYTDVEGLSFADRLVLLGRAWSVDAVGHLLKGLREEFVGGGGACSVRLWAK